MSVLGYAQGATLEALGSELVADVAAGSLVLPVEWTGQFDDDSGVLTLNGVTYTYSAGAIDEDAATITLDSVTVADATIGDAVTAVSGGEAVTELVLHVSCGDGDDVEVVVAFRDRDLWPEGDYDEPVPVILSDDLETIIDVPGRTPSRDGSKTDLSGNEALEQLDADLTELNEVTLPQLQDDLAANNSALAGISGLFPIGATSISDGAISTPKLAANAVNADKIAANSIGAGHIVANAIGADEIAANSIGADKIVANAIGADELAANAVTAGKIAADAIDGKTITGATVQTAGSGARVVLAPIAPLGSVSHAASFYHNDGLGGYVTGWATGLFVGSSLVTLSGGLSALGYVTGGRLRTTAPQSTGSAANVFMNTDGELAKSTSSLRYKDVIGPTGLDPATVLALDDIAFTQKDSDDPRVWFGFAAEQAHELGMTAFVDYDAEDRPDGLGYGALAAVGHQIVLRDHEKRIAEQADEIAGLKAELAELRALITNKLGD